MVEYPFLPLWNGQKQQGWSHVLLWPNTQQLEAPEPGLWSCTAKTKGHLHQETKPGCTKYIVLQTLIKHSKEKLKIPNTTNQEISKEQVKWSYWFYGWQITEELSHLNKGLFIKVLFNGFERFCIIAFGNSLSYKPLSPIDLNQHKWQTIHLFIAKVSKEHPFQKRYLIKCNSLTVWMKALTDKRVLINHLRGLNTQTGRQWRSLQIYTG